MIAEEEEDPMSVVDTDLSMRQDGDESLLVGPLEAALQASPTHSGPAIATAVGELELPPISMSMGETGV